MIYHTPAEKAELDLIRKRFSDHKIINPIEFEGRPEKQGKNQMDFCKKIVSTCKTLVFTKWEGEITCGVVQEANHALDNGIAVFELAGKKFIQQTLHVTGLSFEETLDKYYPWRLNIKNRRLNSSD